MIGWNFPLNNYGQVTGLNDAGIETFKGNPWESLAREIIQNSLDAAQLELNKPVEVHFELDSLPVDKYPCKQAFVEILNLCESYWKNNTKTKNFFEKAIKLMKLTEIPILKISDYNTTGLTGSDNELGSNWHNLIKSVGASDKGSVSGGSYGIGKHAPFACSQIRTVFYGTKDCNGNVAFQGVSKLVTHMTKNGKTTQGTGYYGITDRNRPILDFSSVDSFFHRTEVGTDVFVAGFSAVDGWESKIIKSVLENFFIAIKEGRLTVRVGEIPLNSNTLLDLLDIYIKSDPECLSDKYYNALVSPKTYHFFLEDFEGLGRIDLNILPERDYPKRVAMVRKTGMKIYDKGHFQTPLKFAGVMLASGEKLNEFLRSTEPPNHNAWEYQRHENENFARNILKKLNSWINEQVRSITSVGESEELDVEGISQYLPDDLDEAPMTNRSEATEGEKGAPKEVEIESIYRPSVSSIATAGAEVAAAAEGNQGANKTEGGKRNKSKGGTQSTKKGDTSESPGNDGSIPGKNNKSPSKKSTPLYLKHVRIFCIDYETGLYNISFEPGSNGEGFLFLKVVGEVGEEPAPIKSAIIKDSGQQINVKSNGVIGPIKFVAGVKGALLITLNDSLRCALEVSVNAN